MTILCFYRSRSRVNLRVLRPLTRGPQGQPSPLHILHGRPGVQGSFLTSHGQVLHGGPRAPHSMATGFPFPQGCCLALSALFPLLRFVRTPAMSLSPSTLPVTGAVPVPHPSSRVYTPPCRQQPSGAVQLDPHPSGDLLVCLAWVASIPSYCVFVFFSSLVFRSQKDVVRSLPHRLLGPVPASHPITCAHTPPGRRQPKCISHSAASSPVARARGTVSRPLHWVLLKRFRGPLAKFRNFCKNRTFREWI